MIGKQMISLVAVMLASVTVGCSALPVSAPQLDIANAKTGTASQPEPTVPDVQAPPPVEEPPVIPQEQRVTLMAVGDIMVHDQNLEAAWDPKTKSYNFLPSYTKVMPLFKQADWVIGNLETTMAGKDQRFTGYPMFNSPESLAKTLKQVGFTALTNANNHSLDRRELGVIKTIDHLNQAGIPHTGTFKTEAERNEPLIIEKNGLKMGIVSYTYGTNGIPLPKGKPYMVNLINPELIKKDVARARQLGADIVAVALHFGVEYQRMPNDAQRKIVDTTFAAGADLILGHHPHVVQPYEWRELTNPDGSKRKGLVIYSLGNFISAQRGDYKDVGAILKVVLKKTVPGQTVLEQAEVIPTYVVFERKAGKRSYTIYPLAQTVQAYKAKQEKSISPATFKTMERLLQEMTVHVGAFTSPKKAM